MSRATIMVTGGAGYIGSHVCVALLEAGHEVVAVDNLSNASEASLDRVGAICSRRPVFRRTDIRDEGALHDIMMAHDVGAVVHLAGLKAVGESVAQPLLYYDNNVNGTLRLISAMRRADVRTLVFSSSATVYGVPAYLPLDEAHPLAPTNPYGRTKLIVERMLEDLQGSDDPRGSDGWRIGVLRYFNPAGAHESGLIGEHPLGVPNNLLPFVAQVAVGRRDRLTVWGSDYPTADGTGVRDFIHVVDLAAGHLSALRHLDRPGLFTFNLGTGEGASVLDVVRTFEAVSGRRIPYEFAGRRPGDVAVCFADPGLAAETLGWRSTRTLEQMCADHWRWQANNPTGYGA